MLKLPEEQVVSLELAHRPDHGPVDVGTGFSHLAFQSTTCRHACGVVGSGDRNVRDRASRRPGRAQTSWLVDPDGYRIELVQWPPGHPGLTAASFE